MDLSKLSKLKEMLQTEKEFRTLQDFFLTHFGENPEFTALGEPGTHPLVFAALSAIVEKLYGAPTRVDELRLVHVKEGDFYHGAFLVKDTIGTVFYFDDIHWGLACFAGAEGLSHYSQFSGRPLRPIPQPSVN